MYNHFAVSNHGRRWNNHEKIQGHFILWRAALRRRLEICWL